MRVISWHAGRAVGVSCADEPAWVLLLCNAVASSAMGASSIPVDHLASGSFEARSEAEDGS